MSEEYLICFDTDRIKEYVFATDKLREVRGASWLLTEFIGIRLRRDERVKKRLKRAMFSGVVGLSKSTDWRLHGPREDYRSA